MCDIKTTKFTAFLLISVILKIYAFAAGDDGVEVENPPRKEEAEVWFPILEKKQSVQGIE